MRRRIFRAREDYYAANPETLDIVFIYRLQDGTWMFHKSGMSFNILTADNDRYFRELRLVHTKAWKLLNNGSLLDFNSPRVIEYIERAERLGRTYLRAKDE